MVISTHTPLAGRDMLRRHLRPFYMSFLLTRPSRGATTFGLPMAYRASYFYSHAPRGARLVDSSPPAYLPGFLLTRPSRGATRRNDQPAKVAVYFYSHAPRGARLFGQEVYCLGAEISTHTPLAGRDRNSWVECCWCCKFLLTRPSRGATHVLVKTVKLNTISTHTPLAGRDPLTVYVAVAADNFYSHAPRGARLNDDKSQQRIYKISTHTPLAGRDLICRLCHKR